MIENALHDAIAAPAFPSESGEILPWLWTTPLFCGYFTDYAPILWGRFPFSWEERIAKIEMLESFKNEKDILYMVDNIRASINDGNTTFTGLVCSYLSAVRCRNGPHSIIQAEHDRGHDQYDAPLA